MPLRAVVFDFDGVLANSEPLHLRAYQQVLAERGVVLTRAEYYDRYLGYDDVGAFRAIGSDHGHRWSVDAIAALVDAKAARLEQLEREASVLFPGAEAAVRRAAAAVPIAIASGALRAEILRVLERAGLAGAFAAVVAAEDTPASKPAPDPYLRAVERLSAAAGSPLAPAECAAVEDSHWGLDSARAAGLKTVAVAHTYPAAALQAADLVVTHLDQLTIDTLRGLWRT
jgi:beta-phosphoglucomutase